MKIVLKPVAATAAAVMVLAAPPAVEARMGSGGVPNFYLGAGAGVADFEDDVEFRDLEDVRLNDDATAYKFFAGYRASPNLGIEGGYRNFGEAEAGPFSVETDGFDVYAMGFLPLGPVDLFAKGGVIFWDSSGKGGFPDDDGSDLTYGLGGQVHFGRLFIRLESEWFDIDYPEDVQMFSGSIGWTF
jgi:hypothetical protein